MSNNVTTTAMPMVRMCPICGYPIHYGRYNPTSKCSHTEDDILDEIARLKAAIEQVKAYHSNALSEISRQDREIIRIINQRDEARRWAEYFYWMWRLIK